MMYGWSTLGGMFGTYGAYDTTITNCSATGSITVNENVDTYSGFAVGGFAGWFCGDAQNSLSNVTITPGTNKGAFIGGFAGYLSNDSSFTNCAALGSIVYALNSSHVAVAGFATLNSVDYEYTFTNCLVLTSLNATTFTTALKDYSGDTPVAITVTASTIGTVGNFVAITDGHTKLTITGCSAYFDDSYNAAATVTTTETVVTDSASATAAITTATASWSSEVWTIDASAGTVTLNAATAAWTK